MKEIFLREFPICCMSIFGKFLRRADKIPLACQFDSSWLSQESRELCDDALHGYLMLPYYKTNYDNVKTNPRRYNYPVFAAQRSPFLNECRLAIHITNKHMKSRFSEFIGGVKAELPLLVGVLPFGTIFGLGAAAFYFHAGGNGGRPPGRFHQAGR